MFGGKNLLCKFFNFYRFVGHHCSKSKFPVYLLTMSKAGSSTATCAKRKPETDEEEIAVVEREAEKAEPAKKKARLEEAPISETVVPPIKKRRVPIESRPLEIPEIYSENGLLKVKPYWFLYSSSVKERWRQEKLIDVVQREFHGKNPDFFNVAIRLGRLRINGEMTETDYRLKPNDVLTNIAHRHEVPVLDRPIKILVNNDDVLVVDKPCSLPCHPCGRYFYNSLTKRLKREHGLDNLRLMYRLDRLTSGLLIMSKTTEMDLKLKAEISTRRVSKTYICKVAGKFPCEPIECTKPIGSCEPKMGVQWILPETGKECLTRFELIFTDSETSIVRCMPKTGRTHQIRVHLQYLGYPIVNDYMYNNTVWGPNKGKNGEYSKSHAELRKDLCKEFGAENWVVDFEKSYEAFMIHKNTLKDSQAVIFDYSETTPKISSTGTTSNDEPGSTEYDPFCIDCHVTPRLPTENDLLMFLHCWKYEGPDWSYETEWPDWAKESCQDC